MNSNRAVGLLRSRLSAMIKSVSDVPVATSQRGLSSGLPKWEKLRGFIQGEQKESLVKRAGGVAVLGLTGSVLFASLDADFRSKVYEPTVDKFLSAFMLLNSECDNTCLPPCPPQMEIKDVTKDDYADLDCCNREPIPMCLPNIEAPKKMCRVEIPPSPPCPDICLESTEYCCTDSAAYRELVKCELNRLLALLEEERCCAIQQYQQSDQMLAAQREYCAQVIAESERCAEGQKCEAFERIDEAERRARELKEDAERRIKEAEQRELEERCRMEQKKLDLLNQALEMQVREAEAHMADAVRSAIYAEKDASRSIRGHVSSLCRAVSKDCGDMTDMSLWTPVCEAATGRMCAIQKSMESTCCARKKIDFYRKVVSDGRRCREVCDNPILAQAEDKINQANCQLDQAFEETRRALCDLKTMGPCQNAFMSWARKRTDRKSVV